MNRATTIAHQLSFSNPVYTAKDYVEVHVNGKSRMGLLLIKRPPFRHSRLVLPSPSEFAQEERGSGRDNDDAFTEEDLLDRTSSPGSLSAPVRRALIDGLETLQREEACDFIVIASLDTHVFSLGIDTFTFDEGVQSKPTVQDVCEALVRCVKPTIAVLHGKCYSWGLEVALCATYRVAVDGRSWLSFPEVRLAMIPASVIGIQALVRRAGVRTAVRLLCSGEVVTAARAQRLGLVDAVWKVPETDAQEEEAEGRGYSKIVFAKCLAFAAEYVKEELGAKHTLGGGIPLADSTARPYDDPVTSSLIPTIDRPTPKTVRELLVAFPNEANIWSQVRMFCAWAAHQVSITQPRRIKAPYYLIESIRIATTRFTPDQSREQLGRLHSLFLKCTRLPETMAVQHSYQCVACQYRWTALNKKLNVPVSVPRPLSSALETKWIPPPSVKNVSIISEDHAYAAFLAAMLLHAKPSLNVVILCLRPYHHSLNRRRRGQGSFSSSSSSSSSDDEEDDDDADMQRRQEIKEANKMRYRNMEELRSTVMDYMWLFRGAAHPDNGPASPSGMALRTQLSAQLRVMDVVREHGNGGWYNVPRAFYDADILFDCAYPWTTIPSSSALSGLQTVTSSSVSSLSSTRKHKNYGVTEQRLRRWAFLDANMKLHCIFVLTTPTTNLNVISYPVVRHRNRVIGAFFAPRVVNHAGVVEVCHTPHTSTDVLRFSLYFFQQLSCYATVVRSPICGYVVCRLLFAGLYQAHSMLLDGCFPIELERAMRHRLQTNVSFLKIEDLWGLDWCAVVRERISAADLPKRDAGVIPREMIAQERVGRRTGEGWFRYDKVKGREYYLMNKNHTPRSVKEWAATSSAQLHRSRSLLAGGRPNPRSTSVLPLLAWPPLKVQHNRRVELDYINYCRASNLFRRDVTEMEMTERMCLAVVNEAVRMLSDGVVGSSRDIDLLSIYALGFPVWTGGVLFEADQYGDPKSLLYKLRIYTRALSEAVFPPPCRAIVQMAASDRRIHTAFP